jgi:hypothetical protein
VHLTTEQNLLTTHLWHVIFDRARGHTGPATRTLGQINREPPAVLGGVISREPRV